MGEAREDKRKERARENIALELEHLAAKVRSGDASDADLEVKDLSAGNVVSGSKQKARETPKKRRLTVDWQEE